MQGIKCLHDDASPSHLPLRFQAEDTSDPLQMNTAHASMMDHPGALKPKRAGVYYSVQGDTRPAPACTCEHVHAYTTCEQHRRLRLARVRGRRMCRDAACV